ADLDAHVVAHRLRHEIAAIFDTPSQLAVVKTAGRQRYVVRVPRGDQFARLVGLLDPRGRPIHGIPPHVVAGTVADAEAAWRGAFLARGYLNEAAATPVLEIACPGLAAGLALVGLARRIGVTARTRTARADNRGGGVPAVDRVEVRGADAVAEMLTRMGAPRSSHAFTKAWQERQTRTHSAHRPPTGFNDANLHRAAVAAQAATTRVQRALEILGDTAPPELAAAGALRLAHPHEGLTGLGRLAEPQLSKDAVAGRIRRLINVADRDAAARGIPDTTGRFGLERRLIS
ncbi:MAG: DNA-binding protein WhiA, partial [Candidatus Nanopelagicales bacterium]